MNNQGHSQSDSLIAHESRTKDGAAFKLHSEYQSIGDQLQAIEALVKGFREGSQCQTRGYGLWQAFTMANVIAQLKKPKLILAHNKTLAAQLYDL